jgi:hypothetical protein
VHTGRKPAWEPVETLKLIEGTADQQDTLYCSQTHRYSYRIEMHTHCCLQIFGRAALRHSNRYLRNRIIGDSTGDLQIKVLMCSERNLQVRELDIIHAKRTMLPEMKSENKT